MIVSRHYPPSGPGGVIRGDFIHSRLWKHIEHLIQRITLGTEKYSVAKTRTLSSIRALLLLTDWHPRSIHFPPDNDGWDASLAPSVDDIFTPREVSENESSRRWREDVFEPAKRSDRLSWMLVGIATTLAHELGVFRQMEDERSGEASNGSHVRLRQLLYLYTTQLALRLGSTSVFPQEFLLDVLHPNSAKTESELEMNQWIELTKMLSTAADMFFESPAGARRLLRSTRYLTLLNHYKPLMDAWLREFRLYYGMLAIRS
jgi:hypothetical protein